MKYLFPKAERLKSKKTISHLFSEGKTLQKYPIKLFYIPQENANLSQVAFAVPKRNFKTAVSRNRIKRLMRESYRLHKHMLSNTSHTHYAFLFLYLGKELPSQKEMHQSISTILKKL